jgi:hypothetical protein
MKKMLLRLTLFATACVVAITQILPVSPLGAWLFIAAISALLTTNPQLGFAYTTTLTTAEIVADFFEAFRKMVPSLKYFSTDFSSAEAKYQQQIIAHVGSLPTAVDHNQSNGYFNAPASARGLLTDVPVVMDTWKDVVLKFAAADLVVDRSYKYTRTVNMSAYVLGKAMVDSIIAKVVAANISNGVVCTMANATAAKLRSFTAQLNSQGAPPIRFGLVNSGFMTGLLADSVVASSFLFGQRQEGAPIMTLNNIQGFQEVTEYSETWPTGLNGFFFSDGAVIVASRLPADSIDLARQRGVPIPLSVNTQTDPQSGLTVLALERLNTQNLDLELCFSVMFGSSVGKQGGAAGTIMDPAGLRVTET